MVHIQKESTSAEVFRLKGDSFHLLILSLESILILSSPDELDALEILHQWRTTKLTPSLVEFIYAGRFTVTIPCIKFRPFPARISIQRTKASRSERDSFPQFTEMMVKGALKHVSQMPGPTLRRVSILIVFTQLSPPSDKFASRLCSNSPTFGLQALNYDGSWNS